MKILVSAACWAKTANTAAETITIRRFAFCAGIRWFRSVRPVLGQPAHTLCPAEIVCFVVTNKEGIKSMGVPGRRSQGPCHRKRKWGGACHPATRSPSCGVKEIYDGTFSGTKFPDRAFLRKC